MKKNCVQKYFGASLKGKSKFGDFVRDKNLVFDLSSPNEMWPKLYGKKVKLTLYTVVVVVLTIFSTLIISNIRLDDKGPGAISLDKNIESVVERGYVDRVIAFGPNRISNLYQSNVLLKSSILSESDKEVLREYEKKGYSNLFYNVYFGTKDSKDVVCIHHLGKPYTVMVFESNLDYSFQSIVEYFESQSKATLTKEFLESNLRDSSGLLIGGIVVSFVEIDNRFEPYYMAIIEDEVYVFSN